MNLVTKTKAELVKIAQDLRDEAQRLGDLAEQTKAASKERRQIFDRARKRALRTAAKEPA